MMRSATTRATAYALLSSASPSASSAAFVVGSAISSNNNDVIINKGNNNKNLLGKSATSDGHNKALLHSSAVRTTKTSCRMFSSSTDSNSSSSSRGLAAVDLLPVYLSDARAVQTYHPVDAPNGALQLSVAENKMLEDILVPALSKFVTIDTDNDGISSFQNDLIYYQPTHGRLGLRQAMAGYLERILKLPTELDQEGLVLGAGCNAVLENLCFCLAEQGDSVLIPTPYYAAFEFDLVARAGLNIVPVNTMDFQMDKFPTDDDSIPSHAYYPNKLSLNAAYEAAKSAGSKPKILLLSHPNNPLGVSYPASVVKECIDWCRENQVHLLSDEIYAGSIHGTKNQEGDIFQSAIALGSNPNSSEEGLGLGPYVHFVYGLAKDFALSGLRVGVAYSENMSIRQPMQKVNDLCQISSQTQLTVERMLKSPSNTIDIDSSAKKNDESMDFFTDKFLNESNTRIRSRCDRLQNCLDDTGIPYLDADSGLFVWMDLREFLPNKGGDIVSGKETEESKNKRERELYLDLLNQHGLLFTPGRSMKNEVPGFFRCVFTAASDEEFDLGLQRILKFVTQRRK
mmetsp:Transcript_29675/g.28531  ORF Transcript_29675/g.28531 Transcript_29675/m.28531 type:complete len:570 (-) Transcript_29675:194-1903(-)|eukprot:CAMPEP_0197828790 /NCGR_PEP_ID=MMETSP1437-20131217/5315_1 /TAXON_ID=49252 ORGANISM="Eucampia antarctica, Strain CCMP1452" /NCGR_SAMPLE_ID=MMETSP1437 /ASSEMBLY_ACC=CAM_ASM_001096 /LENGTH=569 /DNA_ID=CAMNT_0043430167 /DNA_START=201 /DNA_END=1910 /DNA_ORIENTATION=+